MQGSLAERACCSEGEKEIERERNRESGLQAWPNTISQPASQTLIPLHGKCIHLNDLHIDRGHCHVGVIKTLCLRMLP